MNNNAIHRENILLVSYNSNMSDFTTSFDSFAEKYDQSMGDTGNITHQKTIDKALFEAIGDFKDKIIYDIACGNGYIARKLDKEGAKEVFASDISEKLIKIAQEKYSEGDIEYSVRDASDFSQLPVGYFDLVVMNMAVHYIQNFEVFVRGLKEILKPGGRFVFTLGHPLSKLAWLDIKHHQHSQGEPLQAAKNYLKVGETTVFSIWSGKEDLKLYRAPLSYYINILADNGLLVDKFIEPETETVMNDVTDKTPLHTSIPIIIAIGAKKI